MDVFEIFETRLSIFFNVQCYVFVFQKYKFSEKNVNVQRMAAITGKLGMKGGVKQGFTKENHNDLTVFYKVSSFFLTK